MREIWAVLEVIEDDDSLYAEANFGGRQEALDVLEVGVLDRVEGQRAGGSPEGALVALKQRAEAARIRLEAVDEGLFRRLRAGIRSGTLRGRELQRQLEAYARGAKGPDESGYDSLDALVSGILFSAAAPEGAVELGPEMVPYQPTPARIVFELVERAGFQKHDTFYDLGSGLGEVVILVHLLSGATAKGVEIDPAYCEYARRCAHELNLSRVEFIHADAREVDYTDGMAFFLYTPFVGQMLQEVMGRLKEEAAERSIRVYTYGPCTPEVARLDWLLGVGPADCHTNELAAFAASAAAVDAAQPLLAGGRDIAALA